MLFVLRTLKKMTEPEMANVMSLLRQERTLHLFVTTFINHYISENKSSFILFLNVSLQLRDMINARKYLAFKKIMLHEVPCSNEGRDSMKSISFITFNIKRPFKIILFHHSN